MKPKENIEKIISNFNVDINAEKDRDILDELQKTQAKSKLSEQGGGEGGEGGAGDGGGKQNQAYWQGELSRIKGEISSLEREIPELEAELSMFQNAPPDDVYSRQQVRVKKTKELEKAVKNAKERLTAAKKELKDLHTRARRAGVPPGWLRQKKSFNKAKGGGKKVESDKEAS